MAESIYLVDGSNPSNSSFSFSVGDSNKFRWDQYATLKFYNAKTMAKTAYLFLFVGLTSTYSSSTHNWSYKVSLNISKGSTQYLGSDDYIEYKVGTQSWTTKKISDIVSSKSGQTTLFTSSTGTKSGSSTWSGSVDCYFKDSSGSPKRLICSYTATTQKVLFTVSYDTNGGNETYSSQPVYYGEACPDPGTPTRNIDYKNITCTFNGNRSNEPNSPDSKQISRTWTFNKWSDLSNVYSDRTVYAEWNGNWTPTQFDLKDGFTRTGYTFGYWANGSGGNEGGTSGKSANSYTSDTTFYAQWNPVDVTFKVSYGYKDPRTSAIKSIGIDTKEFSLKYNETKSVTPSDVSGYYSATSTNKPAIYKDNTFKILYDNGYNVKGSDCLNTNLNLFIVYNAIPYKVNFNYPSTYRFNYANPYIFYVFDDEFSLQQFKVESGDENINFARWKDNVEATIDVIDPSKASNRKDYSVIAEFINADIWVKRYGSWTAIVNSWVKKNGKWYGTTPDKMSQTHYTDNDWFYVKENGKWKIQESKSV